MITAGQFETWRDAFLSVVQEAAVAEPLKAASLAEDLRAWTTCLTGAVVASCKVLAWVAAARGHRLAELPQAGEEYLSLDVMAFPGSARGGAWRFPAAVFELENHRADERVAYSLWKVLCVRSALRVVFAFRRDWEGSRKTVAGRLRCGRRKPFDGGPGRPGRRDGAGDREPGRGRDISLGVL
jgi:hypothetical protein